MDRDHLLGLKKLQKTIFSHFRSILDQNWFLKKKVPKICLKCLKMPYFRNFKCGIVAGIGRKSADLWPGGPLSPKVFPKFFLSRTDKNSWFYLKKTYPPPPKKKKKKRPFFFFGGGGGQINFIVLKSKSVLGWGCYTKISFFLFHFFGYPVEFWWFGHQNILEFKIFTFSKLTQNRVGIIFCFEESVNQII